MHFCLSLLFTVPLQLLGESRTHANTVEKIASDFRAVNALITKGAVFKDNDFPAGKNSLFYDWKTVPDSGAWAKIVWRRAKEFLDDITADGEGEDATKIEVFKGEVQPTDCVQGCLGDCYLICSFSILAEYGNRIKDIFITDEVNSAGVYAVTVGLSLAHSNIIVI
jgi:hypothetical protein